MTPAEADALIARFMDGATDNAEEQQLYAYFASGSVDKRHHRYAPMFAWYANGLNSTPLRPQSLWRRHAVAIATVAASIIIVVTLGFGYHNAMSDRQQLMEEYAGSYIIRDGVRYTDLSQILPAVIAAEKQAEELLTAGLQTEQYYDEIERMMLEDDISEIDAQALSEMFDEV